MVCKCYYQLKRADNSILLFAEPPPNPPAVDVDCPNLFELKLPTGEPKLTLLNKLLKLKPRLGYTVYVRHRRPFRRSHHHRLVVRRHPRVRVLLLREYRRLFVLRHLFRRWLPTPIEQTYQSRKFC